MDAWRAAERGQSIWRKLSREMGADVKCEIDIDLGPLADELEPVAFRAPKFNDLWIGIGGVICGGPLTDPRLIVRRRWKWPEWLTAEWIFCNCHETWFATNSDPIQVNTGFQSVNAVAITTNSYFQFTPPHCTDWTQSKRRNPNAKATT